MDCNSLFVLNALSCEMTLEANILVNYVKMFVNQNKKLLFIQMWKMQIQLNFFIQCFP